MAFIRNIILLVIIVNSIIAQDSRPSIAVLDFNAKGIPTYEAETLTERLRSEIANTNAVRLTDLKHLQKNDITINLSYNFINEKNESISSGSSELIISTVPE